MEQRLGACSRAQLALQREVLLSTRPRLLLLKKVADSCDKAPWQDYASTTSLWQWGLILSVRPEQALLVKVATSGSKAMRQGYSMTKLPQHTLNLLR